MQEMWVQSLSWEDPLEKEMATYLGTQLLLPLLLLRHFSRVQLCTTPPLGFSRQEHWSGVPFPSPMRKSEK